MRAPLLNSEEEDKVSSAILALMSVRDAADTLPVTLQLKTGTPLRDMGLSDADILQEPNEKEAFHIRRWPYATVTKEAVTSVIVPNATYDQIHQWAKSENTISIKPYIEKSVDAHQVLPR